jgi:hypothetical protein
MKTETQLIIGSAIFIILFGMVSSLVVNNFRVSAQTDKVLGSWACTADTKVCPDGSSVGRVPPYCQFASCVSQ